MSEQDVKNMLERELHELWLPTFSRIERFVSATFFEYDKSWSFPMGCGSDSGSMYEKMCSVSSGNRPS